jgi:hypothetical protein
MPSVILLTVIMKYGISNKVHFFMVPSQKKRGSAWHLVWFRSHHTNSEINMDYASSSYWHWNCHICIGHAWHNLLIRYVQFLISATASLNVWCHEKHSVAMSIFLIFYSFINIQHWYHNLLLSPSNPLHPEQNSIQPTLQLGVLEFRCDLTVSYYSHVCNCSLTNSTSYMMCRYNDGLACHSTKAH